MIIVMAVAMMAVSKIHCLVVAGEFTSADKRQLGGSTEIKQIASAIQNPDSQSGTKILIAIHSSLATKH